MKPVFADGGEAYAELTGEAEYEAIYRAAVDPSLPAGCFVEVGCYHAGTSRYLAHAARAQIPPRQLFCIDTWDPYWADAEPREENFEVWRRRMEANGLLDAVLPIPTESLAAASGWTQLIAFLFIDADHAYESVLADARAWTPLVAPLGVVAFHDYGNAGCPDVKPAVDLVMTHAEWELVEYVAEERTVRLYRKRRRPLGRF